VKEWKEYEYHISVVITDFIKREGIGFEKMEKIGKKRKK